MREVLFKAKRIDNGKWVEGYYCKMSETTYAIAEDYERNPVPVHHFIAQESMSDWGLPNRMNLIEVEPETVCQYTGLKDKKGKEIYEGDIVKCVDMNNEAEFFAVVEFGNPNGFYSWGYQLRHIWGDEPNLEILLWIDVEETGASCEIIGNIFDNPELLGGDSD